jgi:hypothetical protein
LLILTLSCSRPHRGVHQGDAQERDAWLGHRHLQTRHRRRRRGHDTLLFRDEYPARVVEHGERDLAVVETAGRPSHREHDRRILKGGLGDGHLPERQVGRGRAGTDKHGENRPCRLFLGPGIRGIAVGEQHRGGQRAPGGAALQGLQGPGQVGATTAEIKLAKVGDTAQAFVDGEGFHAEEFAELAQPGRLVAALAEDAAQSIGAGRSAGGFSEVERGTGVGHDREFIGAALWLLPCPPRIGEAKGEQGQGRQLAEPGGHAPSAGQ